MRNKLFWLIDILVLVLLLKIINLSFMFTGLFFYFQLIAIVGLILLAIPTMLSRRTSMLFFSLALLNTLLLYYKLDYNCLYVLIPVSAGVIGIVISLFDYDTKETEAEPQEEELDTQETPETKVLLEEYKPNVDKKFSPGKFVASKYGKSYHVPKCIWAKKIKEKSQVWLNSESDAKKKGYKAHNCINK